MFSSSKVLSVKGSTTLSKCALRNMSTAENSVEFIVQNNARTITLNRANKLNALNTEMCEQIIPRLIEFSKSKSANLILIKSSSEKAFCSGGDVIQCAKNNMNDEPEKSVEFFKNEYNLNYLLSIYGKPVVSLVNGIAMGGGVGLSAHGAFRVVTESTRFAMPETSIGFFNDVGTSFFLPKLDSNLGYYLALTGDELHGFDTLLLGFGTHYVPQSRFADLIERLSQLELTELSVDRRGSKLFNDRNSSQFFSLVNSAIEEFTIDVPKNHKFKYTNEQLDTIEKCFNPETHKTVADVIKSLEEDGSAFAVATIKKLNEKSPLSVHLNWNILQRNRNATIQESLNRELKLAAKLMTNYRNNDFNQYIKEKLIEKSSSQITSKYYKSLDSVPSSVVDELVSLDIYNPQLESTTKDDDLAQKQNVESIIESLNALKIDNFSKIGEHVYNFKEYPHHMGLPTQEEIKNYVTGVGAKAAEEPVTFADAINYFRMKYDNKSGVDAKIKLVLNRKTLRNDSNSDIIEWKN
jgi:3-hydroxyisobutyryl-CoA hydrolase